MTSAQQPDEHLFSYFNPETFQYNIIMYYSNQSINQSINQSWSIPYLLDKLINAFGKTNFVMAFIDQCLWFWKVINYKLKSG